MEHRLLLILQRLKCHSFKSAFIAVLFFSVILFIYSTRQKQMSSPYFVEWIMKNRSVVVQNSSEMGKRIPLFKIISPQTPKVKNVSKSTSAENNQGSKIFPYTKNLVVKHLVSKNNTKMENESAIVKNIRVDTQKFKYLTIVLNNSQNVIKAPREKSKNATMAFKLLQNASKNESKSVSVMKSKKGSLPVVPKKKMTNKLNVSLVLKNVTVGIETNSDGLKHAEVSNISAKQGTKNVNVSIPINSKTVKGQVKNKTMAPIPVKKLNTTLSVKSKKFNAPKSTHAHTQKQLMYNITLISKNRSEMVTLDKLSFKTRTELRINSTIDGIKSVGNIPEYPYIIGQLGQKFLHNSSCAPFPTLFEIKYTNIYWQTQVTTNWTFQIFGAYWDDRELNDGPSIRINGVLDNQTEYLTAYCQVWYKNRKEPFISQVSEFEKSWLNVEQPYYRKFNGFVPYLLNCPVPKNQTFNQEVPISVSLVGQPCDKATNNVKMNYKNPQKKEVVAVCVRAMNFPRADASIRLLEWLEIVKTFGAHKVFLYVQHVTTNMSKVLDYYVTSGFVEVQKTSFPSGLPNDASLSMSVDYHGGYFAWMTEVVPLNDCLYKNLYSYRYLAAIDLDEIFVSKSNQSWPELIRSLENENGNDSSIASFSFRNTIFYPEIKLNSASMKANGIPPFLNWVKEVYRACATRGSGLGTKCFHNPLRVKMLFNHYPFKCLTGKCKNVAVDPSQADNHHHRTRMLTRKYCDNDTFVVDTTLWAWKDKIIKDSTSALRQLKLI